MIHTFVANPLKIPSIALSFAVQREMALQYAEAFDPENGDNLADYVHQAGIDVYPTSKGRLQDRADFRRLLRAELRRLRK